MRLFRPVGQAELDLIIATGYAKYPPRLPEQPIFYPVLNEKYAKEMSQASKALGVPDASDQVIKVMEEISR